MSKKIYPILISSFILGSSFAAETSYMPVASKDSFETIYKRMVSEKDKFNTRQAKLLKERYELGDSPVKGVKMTRGKPIQGGVRVKLPKGTSWDELSKLMAEEKDNLVHFLRVL